MAVLLPVNIVIGDSTYRLKIEAADEEMLRKTVKLINDKILEFKMNFAGKDMQDYIAMALIWFTTEQTKGSVNMVIEGEALEKLNSITTLLDKVLDQK